MIDLTTPLQARVRTLPAPDHLGDGVLLVLTMVDTADTRHAEVYLEPATAADLGADLVLTDTPPCFVEANGLGDTVLWFGQPGDPRPQHVLMQSDLDAYPGLWFWLTRGATVVPS